MNSVEQKLRQSIITSCALSIGNEKPTKNKSPPKHTSDKNTDKKLKDLSKKEQSLKDDLDAVQMEKFSVIIQHTGQDAYDLASQE